MDFPEKVKLSPELVARFRKQTSTEAALNAAQQMFEESMRRITQDFYERARQHIAALQEEARKNFEDAAKEYGLDLYKVPYSVSKDGEYLVLGVSPQ